MTTTRRARAARKRAPIVRTLDNYGRRIVRVPLAEGQGEAVIDEADFDGLLQLGLTDRWFLNGYGDGYVRAYVNRPARTLVGVARVIAVAGAGWRVSYRDRNPKNLCRRNLRVVRGKAVRNDAFAVVEAQAERVARATDQSPVL